MKQCDVTGYSKECDQSKLTKQQLDKLADECDVHDFTLRQCITLFWWSWFHKEKCSMFYFGLKQGISAHDAFIHTKTIYNK